MLRATLWAREESPRRVDAGERLRWRSDANPTSPIPPPFQRPAGFIYMKFVDQPGATACVGGMTGRWFAGKQISAGYVTEAEYESA